MDDSENLNKQTEHFNTTKNSMTRSRFCPHCGSELPSGAVFCPKCGSKIERASSEAQNQDFKTPENHSEKPQDMNIPGEHKQISIDYESTENTKKKNHSGLKIWAILGTLVIVTIIIITFLPKNNQSAETDGADIKGVVTSSGNDEIKTDATADDLIGTWESDTVLVDGKEKDIEEAAADAGEDKNAYKMTFVADAEGNYELITEDITNIGTYAIKDGVVYVDGNDDVPYFQILKNGTLRTAYDERPVRFKRTSHIADIFVETSSESVDTSSADSADEAEIVKTPEEINNEAMAAYKTLVEGEMADYGNPAMNYENFSSYGMLCVMEGESFVYPVDLNNDGINELIT